MVELGDREKYRQRRRRPRAPREESGIETSDEVAAVFDAHAVVGGVDRGVLPLLDGDERELGGGLDDDLDGLGEGGGAGVRQDDGAV